MSRIDVERVFDEFLVETLGKKYEILKYVKEHERKPLVISNLCEQIVRCEKGIILFNADKYRYVIRSIAKMFAQVTIQHHEDSNLSELEKIRRVHKEDHLKRAAEAMIDLEKEALSTNLTSFGGYDGKT